MTVTGLWMAGAFHQQRHHTGPAITPKRKGRDNVEFRRVDRGDIRG